MSFEHLNIRFPIRRSGKPKVPLANDIKLAGASCSWDSPSTSQLLPSVTILFWSLFLVFCFICDTSSEYKGPTSIHLEDSGTWQTCILGFPGGRLWDKDVSANGLFAGGQVIPRKRGWEWGRETREEKRPKREREIQCGHLELQSNQGGLGPSAEHTPEVCPWVQAGSPHSLPKDCWGRVVSTAQDFWQAALASKVGSGDWGFLTCWKLEGKQWSGTKWGQYKWGADWLLHDPVHFFSQVSSPWNPSSYRINTERWQHITFHVCIWNPCSLSGRPIHSSSTPSAYQASLDNCIFMTVLLVLQHR